MFTKIATIAISLMVFGNAYADHQPTTVDIGLKKAFIPQGFDDNDRSQIAVEGVFPNTCYRVGPTALKVDQAYKTITVQQQAYLYGGVCLQVMVPFTQIVDLGLLETGNYKLLDSVSGAELGKVQVAKSTNSGPDDFLYAPINDAYIVSNQEEKTNTLVVTGSFGDRCSDFEKIDVLYQDQVLVVQPVMKRTTEGFCGNDKIRFMKTVDLTKEVHGVYLLHVRALNGNAINKMVDFQ